jgi:class 3 adenylate cyclase
VLFADIKGSMELIQGTDPEDARRILDPTIEAMMGAVHRYEGTPSTKYWATASWHCSARR